MGGRRTTAPRRGVSSTEPTVPRFVDASSRRRRTAATPPRPTLRDRVRDGMPEEKEARELLADDHADVGITARVALRRIVGLRRLGDITVDQALTDADHAWKRITTRLRAITPHVARDRAQILADVAAGTITPEDADRLLAATTATTDVPSPSAAYIAMLRAPSAVSRYAELEALQLRALRLSGNLDDTDLDERLDTAWSRIREALLALEELS